MAFPFNMFDDMEQIMDGMLGGGMFPGAPGQRRRQMNPMLGFGGPQMQQMQMFPGMPSMMMPPMMGSMMGSMMMPSMGAMMSTGPGSSMSFSSTSVSFGGQGPPRVVQSSSMQRVGHNGVREEQSTYQNSHTGEQRMRLGRHIRDRGQVMDQSRNRYTGERRENTDYIGITEDQAGQFNEEFNSHMERAGGRRIQQNLAIQPSQQQSQRRHQPQQALTQGVEIVELSSDDEDQVPQSHSSHNNHQQSASEPQVDFPDDQQPTRSAQRRPHHVPSNGEQYNAVSPLSNESSDDSSSNGRRSRNSQLRQLSKQLKSKKPRQK